jgi:lauroyl/myristoyl acyltransferase
MTVLVFGRPVKIGRGAAMLAYLGKAATYFATSQWAGSGFTFSLQPGPLASDYDSIEKFEDAFGTFYARCFEKIVLGPPEDMVPVPNMFWQSLEFEGST